MFVRRGVSGDSSAILCVIEATRGGNCDGRCGVGGALRPCDGFAEALTAAAAEVEPGRYERSMHVPFHVGPRNSQQMNLPNQPPFHFPHKFSMSRAALVDFAYDLPTSSGF